MARDRRAAQQILLAIFLTAFPLFAQPPSHRTYLVSEGSPSQKLSSGTIWLYSYSWYGLQKIRLAAIQNGVAVVPMDTDRLKRQLDPNPETEACIIVLQLSAHLWYRTPNMPRDKFWNNLPSAINGLGRATMSSAGKTQLILPPMTKRKLTLLYPDGRAAVNVKLTLSIYLYDMNHCGFHEGLQLGEFLTDKTGSLEVLAPLVPLYLDVSYYKKAGSGPAGVAYSNNFGFITGTEANLVLKEQWQLTDDDSLLDDYEIKVLTASGQPRKDIVVYLSWLTNRCAAGAPYARTDDAGAATIGLDPSITGLELMDGGPYSADDPKAEGKTRELTDAELHELFTNHKLTIHW